MWTKFDNGQGLNWEEALEFAEDATTAGYSNWRLPNAKELQSIVDYTRSPTTSNSAAIDPLFDCSSIIDGNGNTNYPHYWTGTTHANWSTNNSGAWAAYVCFGEAQGWMEQPPMSGNFTLMDVHGAGAQRSDPKAGDPADYPYGHGPQGDVVYVYNYVRLVRDAGTSSGNIEIENNVKKLNIFPNPVKDEFSIKIEDNHNSAFLLKIYSSNGMEIFNQNINDNNIDISSIPPGFYIISLLDSENVYTGKLVKE